MIPSLRIQSIIIVGLGLVLVAITNAFSKDNSDWWLNFGGDNLHAYYRNVSLGSKKSSFNQQWKLVLPVNVTAEDHLHEPLVFNSKVYVLSKLGVLSVVDESEGILLESQNFSNLTCSTGQQSFQQPSIVTPIGDVGLVSGILVTRWLCEETVTLLAVDLSSLATVWATQALPVGTGDYPIFSDVTSSLLGRVYYRWNDSYVRAINASSGDWLYQDESFTQVFAGALHDMQRRLFFSQPGSIIELDPMSMKQVWALTLPGGFKGYEWAPMISPFGNQVIATQWILETGEIQLLGIDLESHETKWYSDKCSHSSPTRGRIPATDGQFVYMKCRGREIRVFNATSGSAVKSYWGGLAINYVSPPLVFNDHVVVLQSNGLAAFNKTSSAIVAFHQAPTCCTNATFSFHANTFFLANDGDGTIGAYQLV